jgi:protein SCO1
MKQRNAAYFGICFIAALAMIGSLRAAADTYTPPQYKNVGVDENPNAQIPLNLNFYNERGETVTLGSFFQNNRPVILQLGYFDCPKLCDVVSRGLVDSAKDVGLKAGTDFSFVFVSISPSESPNLAALKRDSFVKEYGKIDEASGFHCLVGSQASITQLASAVGFKYNTVDMPTGEYAHPAVLFVLTPQGKVSRYLYGVTFPSRTLHLALVEASQGKIGTSFDRFALMICCYDVATGQYAMTAMAMMQFGAISTVLVLLGFFWWLMRHTPRHNDDGPSDSIAAHLVK